MRIEEAKICQIFNKNWIKELYNNLLHALKFFSKKFEEGWLLLYVKSPIESASHICIFQTNLTIMFSNLNKIFTFDGFHALKYCLLFNKIKLSLLH